MNVNYHTQFQDVWGRLQGPSNLGVRHGYSYTILLVLQTVLMYICMYMLYKVHVHFFMLHVWRTVQHTEINLNKYPVPRDGLGMNPLFFLSSINTSFEISSPLDTQDRTVHTYRKRKKKWSYYKWRHFNCRKNYMTRYNICTYCTWHTYLMGSLHISSQTSEHCISGSLRTIGASHIAESSSPPWQGRGIPPWVQNICQWNKLKKKHFLKSYIYNTCKQA